MNRQCATEVRCSHCTHSNSPNQIKAMSGCAKGQLGEGLHFFGCVSRNLSVLHKVRPLPETHSEMSCSFIVLATACNVASV